MNGNEMQLTQANIFSNIIVLNYRQVIYFEKEYKESLMRDCRHNTFYYIWHFFIYLS